MSMLVAAQRLALGTVQTTQIGVKVFTCNIVGVATASLNIIDDLCFAWCASRVTFFLLNIRSCASRAVILDIACVRWYNSQLV
jgi:hypothetical protein